MHRPVLRSALGRTARGVRSGRSNVDGARLLPMLACPSTTPATFFSTTTSNAVLKQIFARRTRLAAAASEVGALGDENKPGNDGPGDDRKSPVTDARSLGASRPLTPNPHFTSSAPDGPSSGDAGSGGGGGGPSRIINLRSLPRRLSADGSSSSRGGRGGGRFAGPSGVSSSGQFTGDSNRITKEPPGPGFGGESVNRRGRSGGRGGGRGRGRGRGLRRGRWNRDGRADDEFSDENARKEEEDDDEVNPEVVAWMDAREVGVATAAATRQAILETVVRGVYEAPVPAATTAEDGSGGGGGDDLFATLQRYRAKDPTYTKQSAANFDAKVRELLPTGTASGGKGNNRPARA
ncbi:hypothetical protein SPI_08479 [Niveomyces insectorum RCEF 264]|uniref:Uncharacterized protein n=1 Tax=Niveomyces insectorum RCEF 264 TaxID=1081102 RepID=A0A162IC22_9HYPO|nr:hypothetical protein SPI_08479 [Niveomyces insectorum RCEF 264]